MSPFFHNVQGLERNILVAEKQMDHDEEVLAQSIYTPRGHDLVDTKSDKYVYVPHTQIISYLLLRADLGGKPWPMRHCLSMYIGYKKWNVIALLPLGFFTGRAGDETKTVCA